MRCIFASDGERDSSQGQSSVHWTIQGQNSTPSSSLNNSRVAHITQSVTSPQAATQRRTIITPTATAGTSHHNTLALSGTILTDSTCHTVSSPASGIASTPTPLSCPENLPTPILNPKASEIIYKVTANASYRKESETEELAIATACGVYTSINSLRHSLHPLIGSARHAASCICKW